MSYIGNQPPDIGAYDVESFDGGGTSFTLKRAATTPSILLFIDGVRQTPTDAYSVSGTTLTTTAPTPSGTDNVTVMFMGDVVDIGAPSDDTVSTAKIQDDAVTAAKIDANAVGNSAMADDAVGIAELSATGTASATTFLRGDNSWSAIAEYNDAGLRNDISTLALHSAIADNKAAFNLTNSFVDQYEDATGLDVLTNCVRNADNEYIYAATSTSEAYHINSAGTKTVNGGGTPTFSGTNDLRTTMPSTSGMYGFSLEQPSVTLPNDGHFTFEHTLIQIADPTTQVGLAIFKDDHTFASGWSGNPTSSRAGYAFLSASSSNGDKIKNVYDTADPNVITSYLDTGSGYGSPTTSMSYTGADWASTGKATTLYFAMLVYQDTTTPWIWDTTCTRVYDAPAATGNYTSTTETANSTVSKMGIVVLYENAAGTAALDTDLVAQVSADGGSNYTSAPLTAGGTFSTGVLVAKSNDITISNTGTAPKYKISFANQSAGSKETRVKGVALLY